MFNTQLKSEPLKQKSISLTAYKTLLIFAELLKHPCTKEELINLLSDTIGEEQSSKDTLRRIINTLKKAGCIISRPTEKNGYLYSLISHPFSPEFNKKDAEILNYIRSNIVLSEDYKFTDKVNKLCEKLISYSSDNDFKEEILNNNPFSAVNPEILNRLTSGELIGRVVEFSYFSANSGLEELRFIPQKITMKNTKLYIWGYGFKYSQYAFLNVERIKGINSVYEIDSDFRLPAFDVHYTISGESAKTFTPEGNETIEEKEDGEILVQHTACDDFSLFQRLLQFGSDLKTLSPDFINERFLEKLKKIRAGYLNNEG
ncbi:WYL domain-containing protein [bacterium]|nr:WYL domain-containing protein [bacterium]